MKMLIKIHVFFILLSLIACSNSKYFLAKEEYDCCFLNNNAIHLLQINDQVINENSSTVVTDDKEYVNTLPDTTDLSILNHIIILDHATFNNYYNELQTLKCINGETTKLVIHITFVKKYEYFEKYVISSSEQIKLYRLINLKYLGVSLVPNYKNIIIK